MGKAAKAHRAKVAKRNANLKVQEKRIQKIWQEAFEEQMKTMKEKFESMSGDTMSGLTESIENDKKNDFNDDKKIEKDFMNFFSYENGLKVSKKVVENFNQKLLTEDDLQEIGEGLDEKMKNILENYENIEETENEIVDQKPLLERIENTKKDLESIINENENEEEGLETIQKFDELLKIIKKTDDSQENSKVDEPTEPVSGE